MNQITDKKTVLYISNDTTMGGAIQSLIDMLFFMERFIIPIVVIPCNAQLESVLKREGILYYIVPISRGYGIIGQHTAEDEAEDFLINHRAAIRIKEIIHNHNVSLVHINSSVSNAGAMAAILAGVPYVWHLREIPEQQFGCEFWDKELKQIFFKAADGFIAISECVKDDYKEKYGIDSFKLYNIIDSKRYKAEILRKPENKYNILLAGVISEAKGQLDAIKAVKLLVDMGYENIKLYLVGSFDKRFEWCFAKYVKKNSLEQNIVLEPHVDDLSEIRKKCAISLTTSRYEALGRGTIEAMLAGNIVIGADTGETPQLVGKNGERGYLYTMGDPVSLADTIIKVLDDEDNHRELLIRAQNYAETMFAGIPYAETLNAYYDKILDEKKETLFKENARSFITQRYEELAVKQIASNSKPNVNKGNKIKELNSMWEAGTVATYLKQHNITKVVIYGMGELGRRLYDELTESGIQIEAVMDKNSFCLTEVVEVYKPDENLVSAEYIISTVVSDFNEVKSAFPKKKVIDLVKLVMQISCCIK